MNNDGYFRRHPVFANIVIIFIVAILGLLIVFFALNVFTKHGEFQVVPAVENMSFTNAINTLHDQGFRTDIRDSVFNEEITPGYVVEQFPRAGAKVKPGRKIFLYINAVHPRELIIDSEARGGEALRGYSLRQGLAKLEELGFKRVTVKTIPGDNDRIIRILANGKPVGKMQKVPVTDFITVEAYDGQTGKLTDSIWDEEYLQYVTDVEDELPYEEPSEDDGELLDMEPAIVQ